MWCLQLKQSPPRACTEPLFQICPVTACLTSLIRPCSEKRHLQVNVTHPVQCSLHGKKCTVSVETRLNQPEPDFTKNRSGFTLSVPGN